jgi:hypothetical protein
MITLHGLSPREHLLADLIWACDTQQQATALINSLQGSDRSTAHSIMQVMVLEILEEHIEDYKHAAEEVIGSLR